jgi:acetyl/propionyl-CoA carboxylase alpha subunit
VITWGETREDSRKRMILALSNYIILGIKTPIEFLGSIMNHPEFVKGNTQTNFINKNMSDWKERRGEKRFTNKALIAAAISSQTKSSLKKVMVKGKTLSPWMTVGKWSLGGD